MFQIHTKLQVELQFYVKGRREDEEEDVNSYWMTLRKREDTGNRKSKHSDRNLWRYDFGRGYGPVLRQTAW